MLLTSRPNQCLVMWSVFLFLLGLVCPVAAAEPTLARLSFWVPLERMAEFEVAYEEQAVPVLEQHGLVVSTRRGRTTADSVFSRLFEMQTPTDIAATATALQKDPAWQEVLQRWGGRFGAAGADESIRHRFSLYMTPAGPGKAVEAGSGSRQGLWQSYGVRDGLPTARVGEILQDRAGDLWFGTSRGVSRNDGTEFVTFTTADGLADNGVSAIAEDAAGILWFGTWDGGVSRYDGQTFETFTTEDGLASNYVQAMLEDRAGHLWFGTDGGVSRYDGQTFESFTTDDGLASNDVQAMLEDRAGNLWFGTGDRSQGGGVSRYDGEVFTTFTSEDGLASNRVRSIVEDRAGHLWFGTYGDGVSRYDGEAFVTFTSEDGLGSNGVQALLEDRDGQLWFGTGAGGVSRYDGEEFVTFTSEDGLVNNGVWSLLEDRGGQVWVGTWGGISRYDGGQFAKFTTEDGLVNNGVMTLLEDRAGNLWFGTWGGVSRYDGAQFTTLKELGEVNVWSMVQDRTGNLWFGTWGDGVSRYDGKAITTFTTEDGLGANRVSSMVQDRTGNLWFGTWGGGVSRYDGKAITTFTTEDGLVDNIVHMRDLLADRAGYLWIGTHGGLSRYDGREFATFTRDDGLVGDWVMGMLEDRAGNLWFGSGTSGGGLSRYDGREFTTITARDGLIHTAVVSFYEDRDGQLWFGTWGGGVTRYDGQVFQTLERRDGLANDVVHQILQDRHGDMWLATEGGVTRYRPQRTPPVIRIKEVIADRRYDPFQTIRISTSQQFVHFEFQGSSLTTRPDGMAYVYRLEGFDATWHPTRTKRVEYTDLPRGTYVFQVKAVDRDLNYSPAPATVQLIIHPPYGQLALMGGLGLALVGLVIAAGYGVRRRRERDRVQRERDQVREQLVQELEEELQTARQLQMSLMPTESPQIAGFDIAGRCETVNHVGGDFFQYFPQHDKLSVCLADVTGHAMEAAVPVMMFSGVLESEIKHDYELGDLYASLNQTLHSKLDSRTFVCFAMGELDTTNRTMRLANGGCPYPYHYRAATGEITELEVDAYPLGVRAEAAYSVVETTLESGDYIVFCSDGIIEAANPAGDIFGFEQTAATIRAGCGEGLSAEALIDRLIGVVQAFAGDEPQGDDMTCVALRVEG